MANKNYKFFTTKKGDFLRCNAKDYNLYEKTLGDCLTSSSELRAEIGKGTTINELSKSIWADLFENQPYQITVFDTVTIKEISVDLFKSEFEEVTTTKCKALRPLPEIKKSQRWADLSDKLKGLKSGAYKEPTFQAIVRSVTALANKAGGNKSTASLLEVLCAALESSSKIGVREKVSADLLADIRKEVNGYLLAVEKGEVFANAHKKGKK